MASCHLAAISFNIGKRDTAVDLRLTHAKHVEIWAINHADIYRFCHNTITLHLLEYHANGLVLFYAFTVNNILQFLYANRAWNDRFTDHQRGRSV